MLNNRSILITGGTGSFGKAFIKTILERYEPKRVVIYSRDELKQFEMQQTELFHSLRSKKILRFFIGDVRDFSRLRMAMEDIDYVVHAAALKQVPAIEYNPFEAIKTNILGAQNVIEASFQAGVKKVIALSTDKAAAPINLYGATKLASDKLFIAANNIRGGHDIKYSVIRYGNVMGSRGSVIPFFLQKVKENVLPITDERMTRFNITLQEGVDLVINSFEKMWGGELFIPKIPSYRIIDVAKAISMKAKIEVIGIRPGEKLHEEMITATDSMNTIEFENYYVILPSIKLFDIEKFRIESNGSEGRFCTSGFSYNSGTNKDFLTIDELRDLITKHIDGSKKIIYGD